MEPSEEFTIPDKLPVIFITDTVIFPYAVMPLGIRKGGGIAAIQHATKGNRLIVAVRAHETDSHSVGTLCRVARQREMPDGSLQVIVQGLERVQLGKGVQEDPFNIFSIVRCPDSEASDDTTKAMQETAIAQFLRLAPFLSDLPAEIITLLPSLETPLQTASVIATFLPMSSLQQQQILETATVKEKLAIITSFQAAELTQREKGQQKRPEDQGAFDSTQQGIPSPPFQQKNTAGVTLGKDAQGKNIDITIGNRLQGFYCIGSNGTGKSTLLNQMIVQDIKAGLGVALLDPHGDLTDYVLSAIPDDRIDDVILLDPIEFARLGYYFGLNLFTCKDKDDPVAFEDAVERIIHVYEKIFGMSVAETPLLSQFVRHVARTFVGTPYTMTEIPLLLLDKPFRDKVIPRTGSTGLFWKHYDSLPPAERVKQSGSTYDRIDNLVSNSIIAHTVGQSQSTLNFREILDTRKILLCKLPGRMESFSSLLGAILIGQLLEAALSREDIPEKSRRHFALYVDEFQNFATSDMARLLSEARKYRIASHLFHQYLDQLDEKNKGAVMQAGSLVVFRVNAEDAKILAPAFSLTPKAGDLIERPVRTPAQNVIEALMNRGSHEDPNVNEFVQKYLRPLTQAANERIGKARYSPRPNEDEIFPRITYPEGSYAYNPQLIKQELNILNSELFAVITNGKTTNLDYHRQWAIFAQYLGFCHVQQHKDVKIYRSWDTMMVLNLIGLLLEENKKSPPDRVLDLMAQLKAPLFYRHQISFDPDKQIFPMELTYFAPSLPVSTDIDDLYRVAQLIIAAEQKRKQAYHTSYLATLDGLKQYPVLIDSGKYEQVEGPKMTYADMANMIANEITQYPVGRARAKLTVTRDQKPVIVEHILTTIRAQEGTKNLAEKKKRIIENTKRNYCKQKDVIDEEMRRRQEGHEPPPPTRKHTL